MRVLLALFPLACFAQDFTQRGLLEYRGYAFPQTTPNDRGHAIGEALFRYEFSKSLLPGFTLFGATETRIDTHHQVERRFFVNFTDRSPQRPPFSIRRASVVWNRGRLTVEAGKQTIRWGKADILNPTDRFAPRDYLSVVDNEVLGVLAGRAIYEGDSDSLELVVQPRFTPSRTPLINQRWTVLPDQLTGVPVRDNGARLPGGPQYGLRWNHLGRGYEASLSLFEGHHYLPLIDARIQPLPFSVDVQRYFPKLRFIGADVAVPLPWLTLKGEAGYFTSRTASADEYVLYVIQGERQTGELSLVGGYAGEYVTKRRNPFDFAPDRGLTRSFLGRAGYTIGPTRSVALETAIRQNLHGAWVRFEYSQGFGRNWRVLGGFTYIAGERSDFLGQYRRNSHVFLTFRYSF
jgi:hypothetical protein